MYILLQNMYNILYHIRLYYTLHFIVQIAGTLFVRRELYKKEIEIRGLCSRFIYLLFIYCGVHGFYLGIIYKDSIDSIDGSINCYYSLLNSLSHSASFN